MKSRKIDIFPKGLVHGFGSKLAIFAPFYLGNMGQENVFYNILERKNAFLIYKNKEFKKSKNWHFSKERARKMCFMLFYNENTPF